MKRKREVHDDEAEEISEPSEEAARKKKVKKSKKSARKENDNAAEDAGRGNESEQTDQPDDEAAGTVTSPAQGDSTKAPESKSPGREKKGPVNDPDRLWKREKTDHHEYVQLKQAADAAGGGRKKNQGSAAQMAVEYLRQWQEDKKNWSFRKVRQVWLLQHMYDKNKVSKSNFKILVDYLSGLKGASRHVTLEQSRKIIEGEEDESDEAVDDDETKGDMSQAAAVDPDADGDGEDEEKENKEDDGAEEGEKVSEEQRRAEREAERERKAAERVKRRHIREKRAKQILRELS
eukprot:scpid81864/ scgid27561/ Uncharacterized protein C7orf50 homolog